MLDLNREDAGSCKSSSSTGLLFLVLSVAILAVAFMYGSGDSQAAPLAQSEQEGAFAEQMANMLVTNQQKEIDRLVAENDSLQSQMVALESEAETLRHDKARHELSDLIEQKFSESLAAGVNKVDLET